MAAWFCCDSRGWMWFSTVPGGNYSALTWYKIRFAFDWANKEIDYYVDDSLVAENVSFYNTSVTSLTKLYLYNYSPGSQAWWDEIKFTTMTYTVSDWSDPVHSTQAPLPTVTSITPSASIPGIVDITDLAGTNFQTGATVKLTKTGQPDIDGTSVVVVSATKITCTFDLTAAAGGPWNVVVTNPDAQSGMLADGFCVRTVTGITPNSGTNDGAVDITDLAGTGFEAGMTVKLQRTGETDINGTSVVVVSSTKITCTFDLTGAATGDWDVVVTWPDAQSITLPGAFTVTDGCPPRITGWAIAATHGGGELICPVSEGYIESRTCGVGCLVVSLTEPLDPATVGASAIQIVGVTNGDVSWMVNSATLEGDGSTMRITMSSTLPDPDWYTVTISATVCDPAGNALASDRDINVGSLHGDANSNLTVDVGDMLAARAHFGEPVDCSNGRYDMNCNGTIDVGDMLVARAHVGNSLPAPP